MSAKEDNCKDFDCFMVMDPTGRSTAAMFFFTDDKNVPLDSARRTERVFRVRISSDWVPVT